MAMILLSSNFLLATPEFFCKNDNGELNMCSEKKFCKQHYNKGDYSEDQIDWRYNSWVQQYGLICDKNSYRGSYKQVLQFLSGFVCLIGTVASDSMGRLTVLKNYSFIILSIALLGYMAPSLDWRIFCMGIFVGQEGLVCTIFVFLIQESCSTDSSLRSRSVAVYFTIFALGGLLLSILTLMINNPDILYLCCILSACATTLPLYFMCVEPPKQLYKRGKISELFESLNQISIINGNPMEIRSLQKIANLNQLDLESSKIKIQTKTTIKEKIQLFIKSF